MAVIAPFSKYKRTNHKIYIVMLLVAAGWFAYDGYFNEKFKIKHTQNGVADHTLVFHRQSPPYFLAGAVAIAIYSWKAKDRKIVADEQELVLSANEKIPYSSIESIDKTNYASKGYFIITYKDDAGQESQKKISNRTFDNLGAVLELLVSKITG
jgi:hypothetical protein